ncbi:FAD-dependent oxidoreductase [Marinomonas sp. THO17]|uniref:NAD(P)/FAD-dependent oxidoreductase n=1 Tax=Marinomonas sp. THO17 TaxID=3149048 RepID=UPI00336BFBFB
MLTHQEQDADVIVIGAGIIGISCALRLQQAGKKVLVLDTKGVAAETSAGNAGAFAFADVIPLATPGILRKAPKWLLDPLGPLSIRPAYVLKLLPWLWRFWRASWQYKYATALAAQANLMSFSKDALERQIQSTKGEALIRREGQLQLYEGEKKFQAALASWQTRQEHGVVFELLESPDAIARIQPGIHPRFTHAAFTPEWKNVVDPKVWTEHLAQAFVALGGQVETACVDQIRLLEDGVSVLKQKSQQHTQQDPQQDLQQGKAKQLVIAAGAWSKPLAAQLGDTLPLDTERGYNTTLPAGSFKLRTHLTFSNHGFVVTKVQDKIRVGGAVELAGLTLAPNYQRAQHLLDKAKRFLPELDPIQRDSSLSQHRSAQHTPPQQWMGFRPSMPDSLPVIDYASRTQQVVYAFGHGHLGLTQSAGTAELVCELLHNQTTSIDLSPYSAKRFT